MYWKYSGTISGKEVMDTTTSIYGDPRFDKLSYKLVDFLEIESFKIEDNESTLITFQYIAAEKSNPNTKNAIVIQSDLSDIANKFSAFFSDSTWLVKIFNNIGEENNWIGRKLSTETTYSA